MKRMKIKHFPGLIRRIKNALGMAPINGPKNGMILVTPTKTLTNRGYGIFKMETPIKQRTPIIRESISLPEIKPPKILLVCRKIERAAFAVSGFRKTYSNFFAWPRNFFLLTKRYTETIRLTTRSVTKEITQEIPTVSLDIMFCA